MVFPEPGKEETMLSKRQIIEEILALPVEDRAYIIELLIESMNPASLETDRKWLEISKKRLDDLKSGEIEGIPGDTVFKDIWSRF